jgi:hypothetical protein
MRADFGFNVSIRPCTILFTLMKTRKTNEDKKTDRHPEGLLARQRE